MPIVSELYQTLNQFLHCGPRFDTKRPLSQPIKLREVLMNVNIKSNRFVQGELLAPSLKKLRTDRIANRTVRELVSFARELESTGLLNGLVAEIRIRDELDEWRVVVEDRNNARVPGLWSGYGFEWGIDQDETD